MTTVVVGYDGEEAADRALERAIDEARTAGGDLVVVAVVELPLEPEGPQSVGALGGAPAQMIPLVEPPDLEPLLADARRRIEAAGLTADYVWDVGEPATAIVAAARDRNAGLIVVGKGRHGRIARWLGADVAAEVEREAGCPVIVVDSP